MVHCPWSALRSPTCYSIELFDWLVGSGQMFKVTINLSLPRKLMKWYRRFYTSTTVMSERVNLKCCFPSIIRKEVWIEFVSGAYIPSWQFNLTMLNWRGPWITLAHSTVSHYQANLEHLWSADKTVNSLHCFNYCEDWWWRQLLSIRMKLSA